MKNAPLTARYRPQSFAEVAGQQTIKTILSRAAAEDKVAPAYLFSGTRGVGKTTIARIFAKALNCRKAPAAEPCNECDLCRAVTQGAAIDVVEIDGASNRGIDDVRRLKEVVGYAPMDGRYKVFIIDEAHMLSRDAFNALLKTLEEPPAGVTFIMATTEPHKFPATVVSRCQHFVFKRLSEQELIDHLTHVLTQENMTFEPQAVRLIARRGAGSVRDSMSLLGQVLAFGADSLTQETTRMVLGLAGQETFVSLLESIRQGDTLELVQSLRLFLEQGLDIGFFLRELANAWREMFILRQSGEAGLVAVDMPQEEAKLMLGLSQKFSLPHIHACWQMTLEGQRRVQSSLEPGLALELLLLNLAMLPQLMPLDSLSSLARRAHVAPSAPASTAGSATEPGGGKSGGEPRGEPSAAVGEGSLAAADETPSLTRAASGKEFGPDQEAGQEPEPKLEPEPEPVAMDGVPTGDSEGRSERTDSADNSTETVATGEGGAHYSDAAHGETAATLAPDANHTLSSRPLESLNPPPLDGSTDSFHSPTSPVSGEVPTPAAFATEITKEITGEVAEEVAGETTGGAGRKTGGEAGVPSASGENNESNLSGEKSESIATGARRESGIDPMEPRPSVQASQPAQPVQPALGDATEEKDTALQGEAPAETGDDEEDDDSESLSASHGGGFLPAWSDVVARAQEQEGLPWFGGLVQSIAGSWEGNDLVLKVDSDFIGSKIMEPATKVYLDKLLQDMMGRVPAMRVNVVKEAALDKESVKEAMYENTTFKELEEILSARIIDFGRIHK